MNESTKQVAVSTLQLLGAGGIGVVLGWYLFYVNRHRRDAVKLADFVSVVGVIGGAAVTALFPAKTDLFGAYGLGLAIGFFAYFLILVVFVRIASFPCAWFLDGRRRKLADDEVEPAKDISSAAMGGGRG